ncbi:MAG: protealysin inhibitor emfourin [Leptolyngbya sp. BL-A-14]
MQPNHLTRRHVSLHLWPGFVLSLLSHQFAFAKKVTGQNAMHVTLERSGGFTGIPLTLTLDTATLSSEQVTQLRHLVEVADFFHVSAPPIQGQPDRFEYTITIQDGDRVRTITVGEAAMPEPMKTLLQWLIQQH